MRLYAIKSNIFLNLIIEKSNELIGSVLSGNGLYPLMDERGFFCNMAMIGEMSSGKSTCLNAIFGECIATTDIDRSTLTTQRYYESKDIISNENILGESNKINQIEDKNFNQQVNNLEKYKKKAFYKRWIIQFLDKVPKPKFPDQIPSHKVSQSSLIPRIGMF